MVEFDSPAYILNYRSHPLSGTLSCANLATLIRARPGQEKEFDVYVCRVDDPQKTHIKAKATTTPDRKWVKVVVTTEEGPYSFEVESATVLRDMSEAHPTKSW